MHLEIHYPIKRLLRWKLFDKNPCNECIVRACCGDTCRARMQYIELEYDYGFVKNEIQRSLSVFWFKVRSINWIESIFGVILGLASIGELVALCYVLYNLALLNIHMWRL